MGKIRRVIKKQSVPSPKHNNRLCVELCENVHVHYRNLRLEFTPEEFVLFQKAIGEVRASEVLGFQYKEDAFLEVSSASLPDKSEWNERLQIEEQEEGHFHVHYRNLRLEVESLGELGYEDTADSAE